MADTLQIAVIQFPGINTEVETVREINRAGMRAQLIRWNEKASSLSKYDGYVIGGGFSYEDRVRAGIIAALDPIMDTIKKEAAKGKAVLGICNGAQILLETGLIPGINGQKLAMALARNKRVQDGKVLGTGYYNTWIKMKCVSERSIFTHNMFEGQIIDAPIAHAEGRFTTEIKEMLEQLDKNGQMVFRYCDENGAMTFAYPTNPNGAVFNLAALCNPEGNVMAMMPHMERATKASKLLFGGMRDGIMARKAGGLTKRVPRLNIKPLSSELGTYEPESKSVQVKVSLIITDNTAETVNLTLQRLGFDTVEVSRSSHFEVEYKGKPDLPKLVKKLIKCGVLLNTNKEFAKVQIKKETLLYDNEKGSFSPAAPAAEIEDIQIINLLVRDIEDFVGASHTATLQNRLKLSDVEKVHAGTVWRIAIKTKSANVANGALKKLLATNLFFNPHSQRGVRVNNQ